MISYEICLSLSGLLSIISKSIHVAANGIISFFFNGWVVSLWEKAMETHSSTLAWEIPWTEEPGGLIVHGVAKSRTRLSYFTFTFHFHTLEKAMATHSSILAWRIPGAEEPGELLSMGSHRVRHYWCDLAAAAAMRPDAMILVFWMLSFKPTFSLSSFTFIKRLLSSSLLSAIRVVSFVYMSLLIFLPRNSWFQLVCHPAQHFTWCMYSAYKLNKQDDKTQSLHTLFPIWNQSVPCPVLTVLLDLQTDFSGGR